MWNTFEEDTGEEEKKDQEAAEAEASQDFDKLGQGFWKHAKKYDKLLHATYIPCTNIYIYIYI